MLIVEWIRFILGALLVIFGLFLFAIEVFGSYKFDFVLNRMHVAAIGDTLGIGICMLGLIIFSGFNFTSVKILLYHFLFLRNNYFFVDSIAGIVASDCKI